MMSADPTLKINAAPSAATLRILRHEFDDCVFRGVDGFFANCFDDKPWTPIVAAAASTELTATIRLGFPHLDALMQWLSMVRSLLLLVNHPDRTEMHFRSQLLSKPGAPLSAAIHLVTEHPHNVAGDIRVFGEFHHADAWVETDEDTHILRFCHCMCSRPSKPYISYMASWFMAARWSSGSSIGLAPTAARNSTYCRGPTCSYTHCVHMPG